MKFLIVALAFIVYAHADVSELKLENHVTAADSALIATAAEPEISYLPPSPIDVPSEIITQTVANVPVKTYVPPAEIAPLAEEATSAFVQPEPVVAEPIAAFSEVEQTPEDGYRYKSVRRVVYKHRA